MIHFCVDFGRRSRLVTQDDPGRFESIQLPQFCCPCVAQLVGMPRWDLRLPIAPILVGRLDAIGNRSAVAVCVVTISGSLAWPSLSPSPQMRRCHGRLAQFTALSVPFVFSISRSEQVGSDVRLEELLHKTLGLWSEVDTALMAPVSVLVFRHRVYPDRACG